MIHIDLAVFTPNDNWLYEAWQLNAELISLPTSAEKFALIDDNRNFWSQIKNAMPYPNKCWYSESKESVSVYEIEHFRPTRAICRSIAVYKPLKPIQEQPRIDWTKANKYKGLGYWWLAFDYTNYRNCGKKINNKKGIRFPIRHNSFVAYNETDNFEAEEIVLIDPTKINDPDLLTFDPDGKARPTISNKNANEYIRAFVSIEIYGLNSIETLVKHRETKWGECFKAIKRASDKYIEIESAVLNGDMAAFDRYFQEFMDFVDNDIKPAINPSSEFSAVAKACIMSYATYEWMDEYVFN